MCTVSLIARRNGYLLGMNRDEKRTRGPGLSPALRLMQGMKVICPSEPSGGTWIAVNDTGATFALVNWYTIASRVETGSVSRGKVVSRAAGLSSPAAVSALLEQQPLNKINPFRLIGIFPGLQQVGEWRWNLETLDYLVHPWETRQWISSGFDEPGAQRVRSSVFAAARKQRSAGCLAWLRRLHRSHSPSLGPFSTCMHRADAATVSYTEIKVSTAKAEMRYSPGAPCKCVPGATHRLIVAAAGVESSLSFPRCCAMGRGVAPY